MTTRSPSSNSTSVSRTGNITATFSEPVNGVSGTTFVLRTGSGTNGSVVAATVTRNGTTNQWILNPNSTLASRTTYTGHRHRRNRRDPGRRGQPADHRQLDLHHRAVTGTRRSVTGV